ncbi:ATP-binding cassette domain-containing protein [Streptococcus himalayensis]|uniref:ABC transporter ATP-binding protein n=1 Tax=Streptococcus himalayensis TaxID=1888195 RepID=A0A917A706_9STRE|nr:ATP-binding cassette domain-containing protein [Streptococcus himalayensis]GGE32417.1 ABC transporter ATP-binding protein [Streptococcus himalayensis]
MKGIDVRDITIDIFENLSFSMPSTGLYGVIGQNGAGKSTLFSMMSGEIKIPKKNMRIGKVSYIPSLNIFDKYLTANDYVKVLSLNEQKRFHKNLKQMGGATFFGKKIGKYSLGMGELFCFIYALSIESDVLILDELLDGLDEQRRFAAYELLKHYKKEKLILLTSHNLSEVFKVSDDVYFLEEGKLVIVDGLETAQNKILST